MSAPYQTAIWDAFRKLDPRVQWQNPVLFVVYIGSIITTGVGVEALFAPAHASEPAPFVFGVAVWLWFTVLFANFAEALAEGRGKAQAAALRATRREVPAVRLLEAPRDLGKNTDFQQFPVETVPSSALRKGDYVRVVAGEAIPSDGEIVFGAATIDESAITGESAPVIREAGGDRSAVTGGTAVLSDALLVRIAADPGETFLDRMIAMVEGARRTKTPNERALDILLMALTFIFLLATLTLDPFTRYAARAGHGAPVSIPVLIALLVCLIPTTIGGLLSAIGIAGMERMVRANVLATSGRAVEAAGDISVLLLDKTGTITLGNRQAVALYPAAGVDDRELADAARRASAADDTPEGRSILALTAAPDGGDADRNSCEEPVPFRAETRMSGVDITHPDGTVIHVRKGAVDAVRRWLATFDAPSRHAGLPEALQAKSEEIARDGGTPLLVAQAVYRGSTKEAFALGVIHLKDIIKPGIAARFSELRARGIRTVMITGDNPLTAAAIAREAGVDDFLAEATPENKLECLRKYQEEGHLVAMTGDGTNDAPALAQADVAVAMNSGTQAAKEAANMVDLDSNPTKLIEVVTVGKQMLMTRGALTTFSLANDIAKYFAILPAAFATTYPNLRLLDVMHLASPHSAILAAVIFNALILVALVPLALRGVTVRAASADAVLARNLLVFGIGGVLAPFLGIKGIDLLLVALHLT